MTDRTPEQKLQDELNDRFHASIINDENIRKLFIDAMTGVTPPSDVDMDPVHRFVVAVDYMIGTLGYGICSLTQKGRPHLSERSD